MPTVLLDARDAAQAAPRGVGRYVRGLLSGLAGVEGWRVRAPTGGLPGPELVHEQLGLGVAARRARADVLHAPNCFLPLVRPCPGVVSVHDLAFEAHPKDFAPRTGWKFRTVTPRAVRSAQRVICGSEWTARDVERRYGADPARLRVVPYAASLPVGDARVPEGPYVIAVGDVRAKKNLARLVRAFRALRADGLPHRLVLAGPDAGQAAALRAQAGDAPVELTGWVDDARLDALLRGADALVHPSLYEGFGIVLVEAMARGVPVVSSNATALPETVGDAAVLFDPLDEGELAGALRRVLEDGALRERLAAAGYARAAQFTWERSARATAAVYAEALDG
ncbi:MAG TPA: glycosyltransferase family 1 protein [Solirubrobacteraceae bacterium]|nr:glycosyltransferase family 1 protein [Solirubrobacteraceae bacterium]